MYFKCLAQQYVFHEMDLIFNHQLIFGECTIQVHYNHANRSTV